MKNRMSADKPGFYQGRYYIEYTEQIKVLKRAEQLDEAERLLLALVDAVEAENHVERIGIVLWHYEQLALLYHERQDYAAEIAILERCHRQPHLEPLRAQLEELSIASLEPSA